MRHQEGTFAGLAGTTIFHQRWLPEGAPRAVLLIAHGYGEHSGRYGNVVDAFVPRRYAVWSMDHRGHGKSGGARVHVDDFAEYVADLHTYSGMIRDAHPTTPVYLLGHSMGCFIAVLYAAAYQDELAGLLLSGGGLLDPGNPPPSRPPDFDLAATISRDPAVVQAYRDDPLVFHGAAPASRAPAMSRLRRALPGAAASITLPTLIMAGGASPLGEGASSRRLYDAISSADRTLKVYDGLLHEIFNEPEREAVFTDMASWLERH